LGLRTRAPKSSRKVSEVLARADSEVSAMRSKGARSTSPALVCESSFVIRAVEHSPTASKVDTSFPHLDYSKVMFLRDKDWAGVVKTIHFPSVTIFTLGGYFEKGV